MSRTALLVLAAAGCGRIGFGDAITPRSLLALDRLDPGETLTDFPLLVVLDDTRAARELIQPDGSDLRFYDSDDNTLPDEIEQLGARGGASLLAWVRVPRIVGTATFIEVDYGRATMPPASIESVWSDSYVGVWHFGQASPVDATSNHHDGTLLGSSLAVGKIGSGRAFDGASDAIAVLDAPDLGFTVMTASGWLMQTQAIGQSYTSVMSRELDTGPEDDWYLGEMETSSFGEISTPDALELGYTVVATALPINRWYHVAFTCDGATLALYLDGSAIGSTAIEGVPTHSANPIYIGADRNTGGSGLAPDTDFLNGTLDELRLERVARDAAWITYDDASMNDALITYGPIEP